MLPASAVYGAPPGPAVQCAAGITMSTALTSRLRTCRWSAFGGQRRPSAAPLEQRTPCI
jgi:hypothetical protein